MQDSVETPGPASNVIIQFESAEGCVTGVPPSHPVPCWMLWPSSRRRMLAGPVLDVPHDVTPSQLQALLNGLVKEDGSCTYTFSVQGQELGCNLGVHLVKHKVRPSLTLCRLACLPTLHDLHPRRFLWRLSCVLCTSHRRPSGFELFRAAPPACLVMKVFGRCSSVTGFACCPAQPVNAMSCRIDTFCPVQSKRTWFGKRQR